MPFLDVDGFTIPVIETPARRSAISKGNRSRSVRGQIRDPRRGERATYQFQTETLTREEADAFEGWLLGRGHVWHWCDGIHAASQLGLEPGFSGIAINPGLGSGDFPGTMIAAATTGDTLFSVDAQIENDTKWTVAITNSLSGVTKWRRGDGFGFLDDGTKDAAILAPGSGVDLSVLVVDGRLFLVKETAPPHETQLFAIFPFHIPDRWFALITPANIGPRPILRCTGEAFRESKTWCVGDLMAQPQQEIEDGATWDVGARAVPFRLTEVPPKYLGPDVLPFGTVAP